MKYLIVIAISVLSLTACQPDFQKQLDQTIYNLNAACPQQVDSETRLTAITGQELLTVKYHYTLVNLLRANVDTVMFKKALWPGLLSYIKVSDGLKVMRENGVTFIYAYNDKNGHPICNIPIQPRDYR